ncbi:MAG: hypothetical protein JWL77_930 [Chthonomonadaceae bacterium]|nr:hypothetical protein [Chthonomonadaceae bacterium]
MAITEREDAGKKLESTGDCVSTSHKSGPILLTREEIASLLGSLAVPSKPLSPEVKRAIANYKRIKAERLQ